MHSTVKIAVVLGVTLAILVGLGISYSLIRDSMSSTNTTATTATKSNKATTTMTTTITTTTTQNTQSFVPNFTFNDANALNFLQKLDTPTGLLQTFLGSNTIFLADDQALDYSALIKLGDNSLANNISSSITPYGGLYDHWNDVFVLLNQYPSSWNFSMPFNYPVATEDGYFINVTRFTTPRGSDYETYADLDLYTSMYYLHIKNYSGAITYFQIANSYWNGYGFADKPNNSSSNGYSSYKLALYLLAYKAIIEDPNTASQISSSTSINLTITQVAEIMSKLQGTDGGVFTNYEISNDGSISIKSGTYENGETTSLFVLAE
jgi:hypothetical protein